MNHFQRVVGPREHQIEHHEPRDHRHHRRRRPPPIAVASTTGTTNANPADPASTPVRKGNSTPATAAIPTTATTRPAPTRRWGGSNEPNVGMTRL